MLGRILAANLGKQPGDVVDVYSQPFRVVGVFDSFSVYENGAVFMLLDDLQRQMDRPGQVTGFIVQANPPGDRAATAELARRIESLDPQVAAVPCAEFVSISLLGLFARISRQSQGPAAAIDAQFFQYDSWPTAIRKYKMVSCNTTIPGFFSSTR